MKIGDRVRIKREICANGQVNPWYGKTGTVLSVGIITTEVSVDDSPNVNHREYHNRFGYNDDELEVINDETT